LYLAIETKKSQRYLDTNNKDNELNISDGMKKFVSKKLTKLIEDQICFVEIQTPEIKNLSKPEINEEIGIRLFSDSDSYLKIDNEDENYQEILNNQMKKRKAIKRQKNDPLENDLSEVEKCKAASIEVEYLLSGEETKQWRKEHRNKEYKYKSIKNKLHFIEPVNEFTKCRKKNNWDESKISRKS